MTQLSPNFWLSEFTKSQTAARRQIANSPKPHQVEALRALCENVLEPVRAHFGRPVVISSGFRSPALNTAIGGSQTSQHSKGEAADFEIPGISNLEVASFIRDNLVFDQLILEGHDSRDPNSGWVHVSYKRAGGNRREVMRKERGKRGYKVGLR